MPASTASSENPPAALVTPAMAIWVLSMLVSIQPVTTDLYLPALPAITRDLGSTAAAAQRTLSALLLAFGVSQLVWGPLSDRFGRRPVLMTGLAVYALASMGGVMASSMDTLVGWRMVQGSAMGAVVMCARAIVRDLYTPVEGARAMSKALTGLGIVACLSAPLGGLLTQWFGWHLALAALAVYGCAALAVVAWQWPETLQRPNPQALQPATLVRTWGMVLRHPTFWAFSLLTTATYSGLFTFLSTSPFVFIELLGLTRAQMGGVFFCASAAYFCGTLLCRFALARMGLIRTVALGGALSLTGVLGMLVLAHLGWQGVLPLMAPFGLFMLGHGIHQPCGQSGAVGPFPQAAGVASAMNGFMMMVAVFATGEWLGSHLDGTQWPLIQGLTFWASVLALTAWTLVRRYGEPRHAA